MAVIWSVVKYIWAELPNGWSRKGRLYKFCRWEVGRQNLQGTHTPTRKEKHATWLKDKGLFQATNKCRCSKTWSWIPSDKSFATMTPWFLYWKWLKLPSKKWQEWIRLTGDSPTSDIRNLERASATKAQWIPEKWKTYQISKFQSSYI